MYKIFELISDRIEKIFGSKRSDITLAAYMEYVQVTPIFMKEIQRDSNNGEPFMQTYYRNLSPFTRRYSR